MVAAAFVETDWALSFIMPGLIIGVIGFIIFLFLVVNPSDVGCAPSDTPERQNGVFFVKNRVDVICEEEPIYFSNVEKSLLIDFFEINIYIHATI